ncbi:molybdate ABC transporter permease [Skermanella stibiiresistens SB22]|uniref:Molybdenum transport system permease n=1 Tax=Skermanella stibiiresistens SB22 TaxID=1385369 RepID=W9H6W2_9PROT|nr:molybdate ABC transporter permease subunit [Skermanella stibiiresistens]EWY40437.1 molybdate ABC transporter permease [Skermanella stibiiresistens SB22]
MLTPLEIEALSLSLWVATWSTLAVLPFAILVALVLARADFWGKSLFDGIIHMPLVLPPVVIGYLLLVTLGTRGPIGSWLLETFGIRLIFTSTGASVAAGVMAFPLMVRAIRLSVEAIDGGLEAAARTLGAGPIDRFLTITLPLMLPGILSGAVLAFAASLGEFGATITFVSNIPGETRTLPLAIYTATQTPDGDLEAARLVALSFTLSLGALILSEYLGRRVRRMMGRP